VTKSGGGGIFIVNNGPVTLTNLRGPNAVDGVTGGGWIWSSSPLTITSDAITSGGWTYTAPDSAAAGDDLTVNPSVTVRDLTSSLTLNAGDNLYLGVGSTVQAAATLTVNLDAGDDLDDNGETAWLFGNLIAGVGPITLDDSNDSNFFVIDSSGGGPNDGGTVDNIRTDLRINGYGGDDTLTLDDSGDLTGDTVTISNDGAGSGTINELTAASIAFPGLRQVNVNFSSAGADTVTISPNAVTGYHLNGNGPSSAPGDLLMIDTANVTNWVFTRDGLGGGTFTAFNHATIAWSGFERVMHILHGTGASDVVSITLEDFDNDTIVDETVIRINGTPHDLSGADGVVLYLYGGDDMVTVTPNVGGRTVNFPDGPRDRGQ
jgi:hypothetical protein